MAEDAVRPTPHDAATRGFDGRTLAPVDPPAPGEAPSPAWLAQLGRAPIGDYAGGRQVVERLTEYGLAVPGDDPLYQILGAHRVFGEVLQAQHDAHMAHLRAMLDEARHGMAQLLTDFGAAGTAAAAVRRTEDEATLKRFSAEFEDQAASATRRLREAVAEERNAMTAAIAMDVAEALARMGSEKCPKSGRRRISWRFGELGAAWVARGRSATAWAALLAASVMVGLMLVWVMGRFGPGHAGR